MQRGSVSPLRSQWVSEGPGLHLRLLITELHTRHSAMAAQDSGFGFQNPKQGKWVIVLSSQVIWRVGDSGVSFLLDCRSRSELKLGPFSSIHTFYCRNIKTFDFWCWLRLHW